MLRMSRPSEIDRSMGPSVHPSTRRVWWEDVRSAGKYIHPPPHHPITTTLFPHLPKMSMGSARSRASAALHVSGFMYSRANSGVPSTRTAPCTATSATAAAASVYRSFTNGGSCCGEYDAARDGDCGAAAGAGCPGRAPAASAPRVWRKHSWTRSRSERRRRQSSPRPRPSVLRRAASPSSRSRT
jgi:hypothetical protein